MAAPADRKSYLERLIMGLEQSIENQKYELPFYKPEDIQLKYAKKFMSAMEENLAKAKEELAELLKADKKGPGRSRPAP